MSASRSPEAPSASDDKAHIEETVAVALAGAGVVGVAIGSVFGLKSIANHSDYEALCSGGTCSPAAGPLHDRAVSAGNVSTAAFLLGGALIAGGAVLWFTAPKPSPASSLRVAPSLGASNAGLVVAGGW